MHHHVAEVGPGGDARPEHLGDLGGRDHVEDVQVEVDPGRTMVAALDPEVVVPVPGTSVANSSLTPRGGETAYPVTALQNATPRRWSSAARSTKALSQKGLAGDSTRTRAH